MTEDAWWAQEEMVMNFKEDTIHLEHAQNDLPLLGNNRATHEKDDVSIIEIIHWMSLRRGSIG
jgi:hypothetical protein